MKVRVAFPKAPITDDVEHDAAWIVVTDGAGVEFEVSLDNKGVLCVLGMRGRPVLTRRRAANSYDIEEPA